MDRLSHDEILAMMQPVGYVSDPSIESGKRLRFAFNTGRPRWASEDRVPCVYAWVITADAGEIEIIYLGKAGKGLMARCRQHEQGFRGKDGKGKSNGDKLIKYMADGRVDVFAMWPEPALFRSIPIPSHSAVEDWLLSAVEPPQAEQGGRDPC